MPPDRRPFPGPRAWSLRYRVLVVVVAAVVLPLVWVWVAGSMAPRTERRTQVSLSAALREAVDAPDAAALDAIARRYRVRLRTFGAGGELALDVDRAEPLSLLAPVADPLYGPEGVPDLREIDAALPPVPRRPEALSAGPEPSGSCVTTHHDLLQICVAAVRTGDGRLLHAVRGDRRYVSSLYEQRFQLSAITMVVLTIGTLLALWMGARMVGPIESLRDQVVDRTRGSVSTRPVVLDRRDELGELATAFNELLRAIDERDRSNAAFAADLAHELKNPVAAVRAAAEALAADRPVEGERRERLRRVLADSAARMEVVVHQFLELARAEAGLQDRERERISLTATCRRLVEGLRTDERFADRALVCAGEDVEVDAVPERLETAVRNLLVNAAHYARSRVELTVSRRDGRAVVEVTDDGPGIPAEELPHLFQRYHTTREGGTGLGLALVKAITLAHGGTVEASSEPGRGATFRLSVPVR